MRLRYRLRILLDVAPDLESAQVCRFVLAVTLLSIALQPSVTLPAAVASALTPAADVRPSHEQRGDHSHEHVSGTASWEGSPAGKAYSEFNHHLAGLLVLLIGFAELLPMTMQDRSPHGSASKRLTRRSGWTRLLLPTAMLMTGVFLIIWSDHEGWPVGLRTMRETYFGDDWEMIQHKLFGITLLAVGSVEAFRRLGWFHHTGWRLPLPVLAIVGGLSLFLHSHGVHPAAHKIALHHAVMGTMAVTAGSSKLTSIWRGSNGPRRWELLWGGLVVLIGLQLLIYSE
jgi:uncharacterized membrane protein HdeD (DUF308 family)